MEGERRPFRREPSRSMISQVVAEAERDGLTLQPSAPIRWTKRYRSAHRLPMTSRLLVTLAFGRSSYLLRTGDEEALLGWLLAQPDHSVGVAAMFDAGYRLARGDVSRALLTIENVLSRHHLDPRRAQLEHMQRLRPIINSWDDRGDNFGAWYHLFGMMLYTYEHGPAKGWYVATVESMGSAYAAPGEGERQEIFVNQAGVLMGAVTITFARGRTSKPLSHCH
jgi:hypothetical protein